MKLFGLVITLAEQYDDDVEDARSRGYRDGVKDIADFPGKIIWGGEAPSQTALSEFLSKETPHNVAIIHCKLGWTEEHQKELERHGITD